VFPALPELPSDDLDECLRALAHRTRRAILRLTVANPTPAMRLAAALGIAPATASEHLKVLRKSGLVELTASRTQRLYHANPDRINAAITSLGHDLLDSD
jgi:DNA-binding transcriptional ArsR family regulator